MTTGGSLIRGDDRPQLAFEHILDEPVLVDAIVSYLESLGGDSPFSRLLKHAVVKCCNSQPEPSIRGQLLDVVVLCKLVSLQGDTPLSNWLPLPEGTAQEARSATFNVTKIVSGKGVLNHWLKAVFAAPEEDFVPGVKARNVCLRPETAAGADGAFAAFHGDSVVIVTVACAWYSKGVTRRKWEDQAKRSSVLFNQFCSKASVSTAAKNCKERSETLRALLNANAHTNLRVLVELPRRQGEVPAENAWRGAVVVDERNVGQVLDPQLV